MSFCQMLEILQEKNKEKIVLIKLGTFYVATGRDAVLLSTKLQLKLPRTEKFNIGNEYKVSMYNMMKNILYINKLNRKEKSKETLDTLNIIDAELNCQRIFLRIMKKQKWIDEKKFEVSMSKIYEIGKIIGGLEKIYAKNN